MTVGTPVHRGQNGGTGSTITTASFTPAAGSLILATYGRRHNSSMPAASTITDSTGRTWTPLSFSPATAPTPDPGSGTRIRIGAAWAIATGVAMTVTASQVSGPKTGLIVTEIPGAFAGISNLASDEDASGDPTATMAAPGSASLSLAFGMFTGNVTISPPTGFTELHEQISSTDCLTQTSYKLPAGAAAAWTTGNNTISLGAIMEIRPAGRGSAVFLWFS